MAPANCSNCGADVPRNARCCPACGADEQTGWSDEAPASPVDLPEESFDYDDYVNCFETGNCPPGKTAE